MHDAGGTRRWRRLVLVGACALALLGSSAGFTPPLLLRGARSSPAESAELTSSKWILSRAPVRGACPHLPPPSRLGVSRAGGASLMRMVESPIAGASVSPDGFVVMLSYLASGRFFEQDKMIPVVISPEDTEVVKSPEALTFLQLLQGIDMATPILPPDALEKEYGEEGIELAEVHVYPPAAEHLHSARASSADHFPSSVLELSEDQKVRREARIQQRAPDLVKALGTLNVEVNEERAIELLRAHASVEGDLDRSAFSTVAAAARVSKNSRPQVRLPTFTLVGVTQDSVGKEVNVSAFVGLGLHLRHKVPLIIKGRRAAPTDEKVDVVKMEMDAEAWEQFSVDAQDVRNMLPEWHSLEQIREEGEARDKRTSEMLKEAKRARNLEDLTQYAPTGLMGEIVAANAAAAAEAMRAAEAEAATEVEPKKEEDQDPAAKAEAAAAKDEAQQSVNKDVVVDAEAEAKVQAPDGSMDKLRAAEQAAQVFKNKQGLDRLLGVVDKLQDEADQAEIAMQAARSREREVKQALIKLHEEADKAEVAAQAARIRAMESQEALSSIKKRFSDKLAAVAAEASNKLAVPGGKSSSVPFGFNELSQFRRESLESLRRQIT